MEKKLAQIENFKIRKNRKNKLHDHLEFHKRNGIPELSNFAFDARSLNNTEL